RRAQLGLVVADDRLDPVAHVGPQRRGVLRAGYAARHADDRDVGRGVVLHFGIVRAHRCGRTRCLCSSEARRASPRAPLSSTRPGPAPPPSAVASARTVGYWNSAVIENCRPIFCCTSRCTLTASSEWPPRSKKLSLAPTRSTP